ncbi:MAG: hypothetical protein AB7U18_22615 [Dehalococcoidia bacterium]
MQITRVSIDNLTAMFEALQLDTKIIQQYYHTELADDVPAKAGYALGGRSRIVKHLRRDDHTHIATTHELITPAGDRVHFHAKDILIGEIKFVAQGEPKLGRL